MVRHVKSISERNEKSTQQQQQQQQPRRRHTTSHPPDNIGISCTVQTCGDESSNERILATGRRRSLAVPRDNIGVACLPTAQTLGNIQEVPESDSSLDEKEKKKKTPTTERDTIPMFHMPGKRSIEKCGASKKPIEMGISNVRRPRDDPTKPRKPILPRDNIGFACRPLKFIQRNGKQVSSKGKAVDVKEKKQDNGGTD